MVKDTTIRESDKSILNFFYLFFNLWLHWVFGVEDRVSLVATLNCGRFFCWGAWAVGQVGFRSCSM